MSASTTRGRLLACALAALIGLAVLTAPAQASTHTFGPIYSTDDHTVYAHGSMTVSGGSFTLKVTVTATEFQDFCGVAQIRWKDGPGSPSPVGQCGNWAGSYTQEFSGSPVPTRVQVRMCDATPEMKAITSTCSDWVTAYGKPPNKRTWGPMSAKKHKATAHGWTKRSGHRVRVHTTLRDRTSNRACGWVLLRAKKTSKGNAHRRMRACNGVTKHTVTLKHVRHMFARVCAGGHRHPILGTCSASRRIR